MLMIIIRMMMMIIIIIIIIIIVIMMMMMMMTKMISIALKGASLRFFAISSLHLELSPTRTFLWSGRNRVQITCST